MSGVFRNENLESLSSTEGLDAGLKVSRPFSWTIAVALLLLAAGALSWGLLGAIPTTTVAYSTMTPDGDMVSYVSPEDSYDIKPGMSVTVATVQDSDEFYSGKVSEVSRSALSPEQVLTQVGDAYFGNEIMAGAAWVTPVIVKLDEPADNLKGSLCKATIIRRVQRPVELLLEN